jgi:hypothetical protein
MKNMYNLSIKQWNPFMGCKFDCTYCKKSFQKQAKRQKHNCPKCYKYEPHTHYERLGVSLPNTRYGEFIFTIASGDVAFCDTPFLENIMTRIKREKGKTFLMQLKNPETFNRVAIPSNVIIGTTIETNRDNLVKQISKAPVPSKRYEDLLNLNHKSKMITMEPIMIFDKEILLDWVQNIKPCTIWLGYDTKNTNLPSPTIDEFKELYWELGKFGVPVILKKSY